MYCQHEDIEVYWEGRSYEVEAAGKGRDMKEQAKQKQVEKPKNKRRRGRPEKPLKIDDSPENVARALFGLPPLKAK